MTIQNREVKASLFLNICALVAERIFADLRLEPGTVDVQYKSFDGENFIYEVIYDDGAVPVEAEVVAVEEDS